MVLNANERRKFQDIFKVQFNDGHEFSNKQGRSFRSRVVCNNFTRVTIIVMHITNNE